MASSNSLMDNLFQRTLDDLIKGLRLQLIGESAFVSKALDEIRREIKSTDLATKSTALEKLSYLSALHGVDMSWAAFHAVEVVSSSRFAHKRIGYHAISQSFNDQTPVLLLITNQIRKDLNSTNEFEVGFALECLSRIGTDELARDLTPEVFTLLGSSKAHVKKKAIGVVLRVFDRYPDAVRVCFKRLVENLESTDPQVLSAVVGVFCELSTKDPGSYLPLAPEFYKILVDSRNNWVLIKVLKIFVKLASTEPRLAKRLVEPINEHMRRTGAKSLLFECIRTVVSTLSEYESAVKLAVTKIQEFLVDDDPNLKYLGLHALSIAAPKHLWAVLDNKEAVIKALSDEDYNVKLEALHLLMAMVSASNIDEISRVLVNYALKSDPLFCNEIIGSILSKCSQNLYEIVNDFDWYASLLGEISRIPHCQRGQEIEHQLIDVALRVKDVRPELFRIARALLIDPALLGNPFLHSILSAAAWICGEYIQFAKDPLEITQALLQPRTSLLPPCIRALYIQATLKVGIFCLQLYLSYKENDASSSVLHILEPDDQDSAFRSIGKNRFTHESLVNMLDMILISLGPLSESHQVEVKERARNVIGFIGLMKKELHNEGSISGEAYRATELMNDAFSEELGPVSANAQDRVRIPDELEVEENLGNLQAICGDILQPISTNLLSSEDNIRVSLMNPRVQEAGEAQLINDSTSLLAEHRKRHGMYYLPSEKVDSIIGCDDYPPANDSLGDETKDLANNFTVESLNPKRKPNSSKPRPVVVKLDDGDEASVQASKPDSKDDEPLACAIRNVLLGKGKEKEKINTNLDLKENLGNGDEAGKQKVSSSRRKHRKERRHKSPSKKRAEDSEENGQAVKHNRSNRHGGRKSDRRKAELSNVPLSQSPEFPDLLL